MEVALSWVDGALGYLRFRGRVVSAAAAVSSQLIVPLIILFGFSEREDPLQFQKHLYFCWPAV
jgi:hypothetical protein